MCNDIVRRGNYELPADKLHKVTKHIFHHQAQQRLTFGLVEDCLNRRWLKGGDDLDLEVYNYDEPPADWSNEERIAFLESHGVEVPDPEENWRDYDFTLAERTREAWDEYVTVSEWWRVNEDVARVFREMGKPVVYTYNEWYWGRATAGQEIYMDYAVEEVAAHFYPYYLEEFPFIKKVEE